MLLPLYGEIKIFNTPIHIAPFAELQRQREDVPQLVHKLFVGHVPDYITDVLTPDVLTLVIHCGHHHNRQVTATLFRAG